MPIAHLLEDFGSAREAAGTFKTLGEEELEDLRLSAFEQGYSAGWEDALEAQAQDKARISASLARTLEDLSFTYHEAINQLLAASEPVFRMLIGAVLPKMIDQSFTALIVTELNSMTRDQLSQPVLLTVPAGAGAALDSMISGQLPVPVKVVEDSGLGEGQAGLRIGNVERALDSARLMKTFGEAVDAFFYQINKEAQNG